MLRTVYLAEQKIVFILKARSGFSRAQCLSHWLGVTLKFSSKEKRIVGLWYWLLIFDYASHHRFGVWTFSSQCLR